MKTNEKIHHPYVGGSALIVIFAVLCLVVFAMMMITTETSARKLSQVSAEAIELYYEADKKAEITFANIKKGVIPSHVIADGNKYTFTETISETRKLHVELEYRDEKWNIIRWQALSTVR